MKCLELVSRIYRVHHSFAVEAKLYENEAKTFSFRSEKIPVFSQVSLRSQTLEAMSETKTNAAQRKPSETKKIHKKAKTHCDNKSWVFLMLCQTVWNVMNILLDVPNILLGCR
jgi:hypothetical protein